MIAALRSEVRSLRSETGTFAILVDHAPTPCGRAVISLPGLGEPRFGHARLWQRLSERVRPRGVASVRFDLAGFGDSPQAVDVARWQAQLYAVREFVSAALGEPVLVARGAGVCAADGLAVDVIGPLPTRSTATSWDVLGAEPELADGSDWWSARELIAERLPENVPASWTPIGNPSPDPLFRRRSAQDDLLNALEAALVPPCS